MTDEPLAADLEVAVEPPDYGFVPEGDARLRCFIYECAANAEILGRIMVENCEMAFQWIKFGTVPPEETPKRRAATLVPR